MRLLHRLRALVHNLRHHDTIEDRLDEEVGGYIELLVAEKVAAGLSPAAARRAALLEAEGAEQIKEHVRESRAGRWLAESGRDVRHAMRMLRRSPGFTCVAVLTLALGIGANTAVFTVVNGVLLRPLAFPEPDRLLLVSYTPPPRPAGSAVRSRLGLPATMMFDRDYVAFSREDSVFAHLAAFENTPRALTGAGDPAHVSVAAVTTDFLGVLGVNPAMGRSLIPADGPAGHVVLLSDALWRTRFGGDASAIGRTIKLDGVAHEVIGVMPAGFDFPPRTELWTPFMVKSDPHRIAMRPVIGRLKPNRTAKDAETEIAAIASRFPPMPGTDRTAWRGQVAPVNDLLVANVRSSLRIFAGAVAFVLLIACANVGNLLLTRATGHRQEMAVRASLGASRGRLIRQSLAESTLLALTGGAAGIVLSVAAVPALTAMAPAGTLPRLEMIHVDGWVLAFTFSVSVLTGILFGLAPALRATRPTLQRRLAGRGRTVAGGRERLRGALVVAEIALALVLLTGAGLLLKSFLRLRAVDPGFQPDGVISLAVDLPAADYASPAAMRDFDARLLEELARLPDTVAVGAVSYLPFGNALIMGGFKIERDPAHDPAFNVDKPSVSPGYFRAMGIHLLRGRDFTTADAATAPRVAIVSQSVAARVWPGQEPIGQRVTLEDKPAAADWLTVVGVVDDVKQQGLGQAADASIYRPFMQVDQPFFLNQMSFVVRSASDPSPLAPTMRAMLHSVDANLPGTIATMNELVATTTAEPRFQTRLLGVFAVMALLLSIVGIYGVLAYSVAERTREIGIRIALGAKAADVLRLILRQTLALAAVGVALGTMGAWWLTRQLADLLYDVTPRDPATFGLVVLVLIAAAFIAAIVPARRARSVDPIIALRTE